MPRITMPRTETVYVPTHRGRVRAVLLALDDRWESLSFAQRAEAVRLVEQLRITIRRESGDPKPAA
jgi:hypothetical protein